MGGGEEVKILKIKIKIKNVEPLKRFPSPLDILCFILLAFAHGSQQ